MLKNDENFSMTPACLSSGYYLSSGKFASESFCHAVPGKGLIYSAASVIADGGRKAIAAAAMAGMLACNFDVAAYADAIEPGTFRTISSGEFASGLIVSGTGTRLYVYGSSLSASLSGGGIEIVSVGGKTDFTSVHNGGSQFILTDGSSFRAEVNEGGSQVLLGGYGNETSVFLDGIQIVDGGYAYRTFISGGSQVVLNGGVSESSYLSSFNNYFGCQSISYGGIVRNASVYSLGFQYVYNGGIAEGTVLNYNATQYVSLGGSAVSAIVHGGGAQIVHDGGSAFGTVINAGGYQSADGGLLYGTQVNSGGRQLLEYSGFASGAAVYSGAAQSVGFEAVDINAVIDGGEQVLAYFGTASGTEIVNGGIQHIYSGATAHNAQINSGGIQDIREYGSAISAAVNDGGIQTVYDSGHAYNAEVNSGGIQAVSGGEANSAQVNFRGMQIISGGSALDTSVNSGGLQILSSGTVLGNKVNSGGCAMLLGSAAVSGMTISRGGEVSVYGSKSIHDSFSFNSGASLKLKRNSPSEPVRLEIDSVSLSDGGFDGGTFEMSVSFSSPENSDKIIIKNSQSGNFSISINSIDEVSAIASGGEIQLVQYDGGASVNGSFTMQGNKIDTGWHEYIFSGGSGEGYYLRPSGRITPIARAVYAAPAALNAAVDISLNSLSKRMGDLRAMQTPEAYHGTWARGYYKGMTLKGKERTEMSVSGMEAGYDFRLSGSGAGEGIYIGLMAGKESVQDIKGQGSSPLSGSGSGITGGAYASYLGSSGIFFDITARAGQSKMDISAFSETLDDWLTISSERTFFSASAEAGKSYSFGKNKQWKMEPKAEIRYLSLGSGEAGIKKGVGSVSFGGGSFMTGIAALNASYSWHSGGLARSAYSEISYSSDFSGGETVSYSGYSEKFSGTGSLIELRAGMEIQFTRNLYLHFAAGMEKGSKRESTGADAGMRFMFGGNYSGR